MKTIARAHCTHPGCDVVQHYNYDSRKECNNDAERRSKWKCVRHTSPDKVLSATNLESTVVLTVTPSEKLDPAKHLFWHNGSYLGSGFSRGDSHKAFAKDFPVGTKLIITARIELP